MQQIDFTKDYQLALNRLLEVLGNTPISDNSSSANPNKSKNQIEETYPNEGNRKKSFVDASNKAIVLSEVQQALLKELDQIIKDAESI